jgi:transitional endoplasmic reticulum ATPase
MSEEHKLKVVEALPKDAGRVYARFDPADMARLNLAVGDIVKLNSKKGSGIAKLRPTYLDLRGKGVVQLDGLTRRNAGLSMDEKAHIEPVSCKHATRIVFTPTTISLSQRYLGYIGSLLDGLPVQKGDLLRAHLFGSRSAEFKVDSTVPDGEVLINPTTTLVIGNSGEGKNAGSGTQRLSYEDVGGLKGQVRRIREMIELPLRYPEYTGEAGENNIQNIALLTPRAGH